MRAHWDRNGRVLLVLYLVAVACVCSFILFEVLDIDGSDFQTLSPSMVARPAESHHDDLKRVILAVALAFTAQAVLPVVAPALLRAAGRAVRLACWSTPSRATHALLPRATLSDGPAA